MTTTFDELLDLTPTLKAKFMTTFWNIPNQGLNFF